LFCEAKGDRAGGRWKREDGLGKKRKGEGGYLGEAVVEVMMVMVMVMVMTKIKKKRERNTTSKAHQVPQ
jgi:hypothetical protein